MAAPRDRRPRRDYDERPGGGGARRRARKASGTRTPGAADVRPRGEDGAPLRGGRGRRDARSGKDLERQRGSRSPRSAGTKPGRETNLVPVRPVGVRIAAVSGPAASNPGAGGTGIGPEDTAPGAARARRPRRNYGDLPGGGRARGAGGGRPPGPGNRGLPRSRPRGEDGALLRGGGAAGALDPEKTSNGSAVPAPRAPQGPRPGRERNLARSDRSASGSRRSPGRPVSHPGALTPEEPGSGRKTPARRGPGGPGGTTATDPGARGAGGGRPPGHGNWDCRCPTRRRRQRLLPGRRARRDARSGRH